MNWFLVWKKKEKVLFLKFRMKKKKAGSPTTVDGII